MTTVKKPARATRTRDTGPRKVSGYMLFAQNMRARVRGDHPTATFSEISRLLGELWRRLPDADKNRYEALAKQDYEKRLAAYKA
ncbi:HMG-box domain-containing protein [Streptomyces violascens]|uniref:hypothetical protein n=1 Tax=Streptomyces violascens TaxID=67381 RepID=UPI003690C26D